MAASDQLSWRLEEVQFALGEGPSLEAWQRGVPVVDADLTGPKPSLWPAFAHEAQIAGAGAVFAFPLQVGRLGLGAFGLYSERPGPLGAVQHADALAVADVMAESVAVLLLQADQAEEKIPAVLDISSGLRRAVDHATEIAAVQLDVDIDDAADCLRAYAFSHDRALFDVADDLITRNLRLG